MRVQLARQLTAMGAASMQNTETNFSEYVQCLHTQQPEELPLAWPGVLPPWAPPMSRMRPSDSE